MVASERISVVIPVYNSERFLPEAVASVRAQQKKVSEIIIVDDASTDGSADVAYALGSDITVIRNYENMGPAASRNRGIQAASGSLIAFLDADDLWPNDATSILLREFDSSPSPSIVSGRIKLVGASLPARLGQESSRSLDGFALSFGCSLIRRTVFDEIGMLDPVLRAGEDGDWFLRAREHRTPVKVVNAVTLIYRRHERNSTADSDKLMHDGLLTLKRSLDRRRQECGTAKSLPDWPAPR